MNLKLGKGLTGIDPLCSIWLQLGWLESWEPQSSERLLMHMAGLELGKLKWVKVGNLHGFCRRSLQLVSFKANGLCVCKRETLRLFVSRKADESCLIFTDLASEVMQHTSAVIPSTLKFKRREYRLHFWKGMSTKHCNRVDELGYSGVITLGNTICRHVLCLLL